MTSTPPRQRTSWRSSIALLIPVAVCLIATATVSLGFVVWSAQGEDQRSLAHETALARHIIELQLQRIPHDQQSVTIWDDAITHTKLSFDQTWIENNLGVWMHEFFRHDEVAILDDKDRPIYAMAAAATIPAAEFEARLGDIKPLVAELRRLISGGALTAFESGRAEAPFISDLAIVGGVPSLVSVEPIVSDSGAITQARGTEYLHVSIVHLDAAYASRLSDEYFIAGARFSRRGGDATDRAVMPLTNAAGRFVTFFDWQRETPGAMMLRQTLPVMAIGFLVAGIVALALVDQLRRKSHALEMGRADAEHLAYHDPLTNLPNRAHFETALARSLAHVPRGERTVSVLMMDLDRFKQVNDTLGHQAGDDLIAAVGQRLAQFIAPGDMLARLGGDEFGILTTHTPGISEPMSLSHRIVEAIGKPFRVFGSEAFVGVSIGIATAESAEADWREMLRKADIALYEAKTTGRNRAVVFEESMNELLQNRHTIEAELRDALRRTDRLSVDFQPLFGPDRTRIIGAEALARWYHPAIGQVSPVHFIPVAEQSGLIGALGELVLRRACEFGARWPGTMIAVNVSPVQLRDAGFPARVFALLAETGMRAADLELEITEGILLEDSGTATDALRMFRAAGIRIALDDFGTGYSSLNYLKRYPVDRIKIDRSFVTQLAGGSVPVAIVEAMVRLAHALNIEVTAEGVETPEQLEILLRLGCNVFQGYLLSPPITAAALESLFEAERQAAQRPGQSRVA
ncbi:MAG TPA: EAL domain-containing protein [Devosia sp.]|nr:EAL domain-containing protein [Devosia sp.]